MLIGTLHENNTYKAIRISGPSYNLYYSIWCNNEHELYDMNVSVSPSSRLFNFQIILLNLHSRTYQIDPGQLNNLLSASHSFSPRTTPHIAGVALPKVVARLDALLFILKSCSGIICRDPWSHLHPDGDVSTLADALHSRFDTFYEEEQTAVKYNFCANGYMIDAEGPMWQEYGRSFKRGGLSWDEWV